MGLETFLISTGLSLLSTMSANKAAEKQAEAEQEELLRQEFEANKAATEEATDLAEARDREAAAARAAMEAIGGFGSVNDERAQMEIAGLKGLDLSRIEGNRSRQARQFQSGRKAAARKLAATKSSNMTGFLSGALGGFSDFKQGEREEDLLQTGRAILRRTGLGTGG